MKCINELNKALSETLEENTVSPNYALYYQGTSRGYYLVEISTRCENNIIGRYAIYYTDDTGPWDVASGFITTKTDTTSLVNNILTAIMHNEESVLSN